MKGRHKGSLKLYLNAVVLLIQHGQKLISRNHCPTLAIFVFFNRELNCFAINGNRFGMKTAFFYCIFERHRMTHINPLRQINHPKNAE